MFSRIASIAVLAAALVGGAFSQPARGEMPSSVVLTGKRLDAANSAKAIYRLEITAGARGAAFGFEYRLPGWATLKSIVGSPISIASVDLIGPGVIRPTASPGQPSVAPKQACLRERRSFLGSSYWVELPANANVEIKLEAKASYPSWPMTRYEVSFATFEVDAPNAPRRSLGTISTLPLGKRGSQIRMWIPKGEYRDMKPQTAPGVAGRTNPPLRRAWISLRAVRPSLSNEIWLGKWYNQSPHTIILGRVRTDSRGRFRTPARSFAFEGTYAILARSQAVAGLAGDWNCGPFFSVR